MATGAYIRNTWKTWLLVVMAGIAVLPTLAPTARAQMACVGDCDASNTVLVNELIRGVNIALDRADLSQCPSFDINSSLSVEVNELVTGVNNALRGCPATPTPSNTPLVATATATAASTATPTETAAATATATLTVTAGTATPTVEEVTPTPTVTVTVGTATPTGTVDEATPTVTVTVGTASPTGTVEESTPTPTIIIGTATPTGTVIEVPSPTPTATQTPVSGSPTVAPVARVAGSTTVVVNALGVIPTLIGAIANGIDFGGASAGGAAGFRDDGGSAHAACPEGGTATRTGTLLGFNLNITLANCRIETADGFVTFNGRISQSGFTLTVNDGNATPGPLTAQYEDSEGTPTLLAEAQLTLTVVGIPSLGGACEITGVTLTTNGTISTTTSGGDSATVTFAGTTVTVGMITFSPSCVPTIYRLTFNGSATLLSSATGTPITVTFNSLVFDVNDSADPMTVSISGGFTSACFGGAATVATQTALALTDDEVCPTAGQITATVGGNATRVVYNTDASVGIDFDNDGSISIDETFPHCLDPRLYECLA